MGHKGVHRGACMRYAFFFSYWFLGEEAFMGMITIVWR